MGDRVRIGRPAEPAHHDECRLTFKVTPICFHDAFDSMSHSRRESRRGGETDGQVLPRVEREPPLLQAALDGADHLLVLDGLDQVVVRPAAQ